MTALTRRELLLLAAVAAPSAARTRPAFAAPVQNYDDGSDAVPGRLVGDPERVIVVGAGWAGLAVANALRNAGVDHVVLESRKRIGGRAHTVDIAGVPVDLGCSWIHGPIGNPMARFADQAGVRRTSGDVELDSPRMRVFDAQLGRELTPFERGPAFLHALKFAEEDSGSISDELGPRASVRDGAVVYLDRNGIDGVTRRPTVVLMKMLSEMTYGRDWRQMSLAHWAYSKREPSYYGVGEGDFPVGGYRGLIRAMAGGGEVRLGHHVQAIKTGRRGVVVHATAGKRTVRLHGSHVVVTVPLGVLQAGAIRFEPQLPAAKRGAIARVGFGAVEKVAMLFDTPFWSDLDHTHIVFCAKSPKLELPWWIDLNRTHGFPGLKVFYGGPFARSLRTWSAGERLELTLTRLREILGRDIPRPSGFRATDWQRDPNSRGSYSSMLIGSTPDDNDTLAAPVHGRLLFAGEATSRVRHSTADGALSSGFREAKRLLRQPAVAISAG
ncbi:MAG: polyamine oxidase [Solirubrobacteraceae bacterium]|jgi:monoamine oxidase|nr:polyamine oxidase [Solirubrobacteraceae bacterium]